MKTFHFNGFCKGANEGWKDHLLEILGRTTTLHGGSDRASFPLLPVLP